jgi:hypothetical protein
VAVTNLTEFLNSINDAAREVVDSRDLVNAQAAHPTWINATGKTEIKAGFAAMKISVQTKLDECNAWLQTF